MELPVHADLEPLAGFLGVWRGEGKGEYPTIQPFAYREELRFSHVGRPFLTYAQRTWSLEGGGPLHSEVGFWRIGPNGMVELVLAHGTGHTEIASGTVQDGVVQVESRSIEAAATAKEVTRIARIVYLEGDSLRYELRMAAVGQQLVGHLTGELHREA